MKLLNYGLIRSICALIVGILLIVFPTDVPKYLVMAIGCLFIIPGLIFLLLNTLRKRSRLGEPRYQVSEVSYSASG